MATRRVLLVRHCEVEDRYRHVCYGRSDVSLSQSGLAKSRELACQLAVEPITVVCHSGLTRTRILAEARVAHACDPWLATIFQAASACGRCRAGLAMIRMAPSAIRLEAIKGLARFGKVAPVGGSG
jgi:D-serine deaminase-like pyridoxal phosphate-dependent protein